MPSLRAPLFSVSLAFACGCVVGLDGWLSTNLALLAFGLTGGSWLVFRKRPSVSLAALYLFIASAGLLHTQLLQTAIAADDLRRLPDEKADATTQWRGVILEEPTTQVAAHPSRRSLDRTTFLLRVEAWRPTEGRFFGSAIDAPWQPAQGDIRCTLTGPVDGLQCGDTLEFAAALAPIAAPLSPSGLDFRSYEAERDVFEEATVTSQNWARVAAGHGDWWRALSFRARDWAYQRLQIGLEDDPRTADFLAGMLIGYRQEIPTDIEQDFRRTGTLHVFAVSGQNIAELVVVALIVLQLCGLVRWRWALIIAPVVLLYCLLTGSPASAVRATVMALGVLLAWQMGRPLNPLGAWSLAFFTMLVWDPRVLLDPGAQLSFAIVLGLILVTPPLYRLLGRPFAVDPFLPLSLLTRAQKMERRFWQGLVLLLASGVAATLTTEPITAIDFHQVTPISIFANLVVVPVAGLITVVGTISVAASVLCAPVAALLNNANWLFGRGLILFVAYLAHQPGSSLNVPDLYTLGAPVPELVVAPLPESACLLVRTRDQAWLINAGRASPTPSAVWHLLQYYGINHLDGLALAEMSAPDNGDAATIVRDFHPRRLAVPILTSHSPVEKDVPALAALTERGAESWTQGQSFALGDGVALEVLHPAADSPETHVDDRGLVLLLHTPGGSVLWMGRAGLAVRQDVLRAYPGLCADVLVMAAEPAPDEAWLEALHVHEWLQMPPRDSRVNALDSPAVPDGCRVWPLAQTGAVELGFGAASSTQLARIYLRPWLASPAGAESSATADAFPAER
jgi:ComEC/Rec2-related protein